MISEAAAKGMVAAQRNLQNLGGVSLVELTHIESGTGLVSPGLIDVTEVIELPDEEYFGPCCNWCVTAALTGRFRWPMIPAMAFLPDCWPIAVKTMTISWHGFVRHSELEQADHRSLRCGAIRRCRGIG